MYMRSLCIPSYFVRTLKNVKAEDWVKKPQDATVKYLDQDLSHLNIKFYRDVKKEIKSNVTLQQPKPCSPKMGPYKISNPKKHNKLYRWCTCGQSESQPFCDNSHEGSAFKPFKFTVEENVKEINLCGCKLTTRKPFCDGQSCKKQND